MFILLRAFSILPEREAYHKLDYYTELNPDGDIWHWTKSTLTSEAELDTDMVYQWNSALCEKN